MLDFCAPISYDKLWEDKRGDEMSPRTGRPPLQEESRKEKLNIRLTRKEKDEIEYCSIQLGLSRTDTIMKGIGLIKKNLEKE